MASASHKPRYILFLAFAKRLGHSFSKIVLKISLSCIITHYGNSNVSSPVGISKSIVYLNFNVISISKGYHIHFLKRYLKKLSSRSLPPYLQRASQWLLQSEVFTEKWLLSHSCTSCVQTWCDRQCLQGWPIPCTCVPVNGHFWQGL